jgi:hypothetical protein
MRCKGKNIMNPREIVQALLTSVQRGDFQKVKFLLAMIINSASRLANPSQVRRGWG